MTGSIRRVMIFIDGSNFYYSLKKSFFKTNIDFEKFCNFASDNQDIVKILYYSAPLSIDDNPDEYAKQQKFFNYLKHVPNLEIYLGRLERRLNNHKVEKGVDVKLAVDLIVNAYKDNYDVAVLISNDADFIPSIEEVKKLGKQVYNVSFKKTKSYHLNMICNNTIKVDNIQEFLKE